MATQRTWYRFELGVPAVFEWKDKDRQWRSSQGVTGNLSMSGMFVKSPICPPENCVVRCCVLLPTVDRTKADYSGTPAVAIGRVVRITSEAGTTGFAFRSRKFIWGEEVQTKDEWIRQVRRSRPSTDKA